MQREREREEEEEGGGGGGGIYAGCIGREPQVLGPVYRSEGSVVRAGGVLGGEGHARLGGGCSQMRILVS